jgi:hypothetical protein
MSLVLSHRLVIRLVLSCSIAALTGCATTPPRDLAADASIKTVVVLSMLKDDAAIRKLGLTVFNNDEVALGERGAFNQLAVETVEARLRKARPSWSIVPSGANSVELAGKMERPAFAGDFTAKVKDDLAAIAQRTGADALFVVAEWQPANMPGRGVGAVVRALPGLNPTVHLHTHVLLLLVDKQGQAITNRHGGDRALTTTLTASDMGLTGDLASLDAGDNRARMAAALRRQLVTSLDAASAAMGY